MRGRASWDVEHEILKYAWFFLRTERWPRLRIFVQALFLFVFGFVCIYFIFICIMFTLTFEYIYIYLCECHMFVQIFVLIYIFDYIYICEYVIFMCCMCFSLYDDHGDVRSLGNTSLAITYCKAFWSNYHRGNLASVSPDYDLRTSPKI